MEISTDEGDDGTQDWPSHRNREVPDASDSEFSSSGDKGGDEEYDAIHVGSGAAVRGGGGVARRGWGPTALAGNLLGVHACRSGSEPRPQAQAALRQQRRARRSTEQQRRQAAAAIGPDLPEVNERPPTARRQHLNGNWADQQLAAALRAVEKGVAIETVASHYQIPRSTLRSHVTGLSRGRKRGKAPVLIVDEEQQLVDYIIQMQGLGFPLSLSQLKLKVALITQERATPFVHGIPGAGWLRWFRRHHPELALRLAQGLNTNRARGLCPANVNTLYNNLSEFYKRYKYPPSNIWNCDESGTQAGLNRGAYVLAKRGCSLYHT
jgi:hypothetical protein